MLERAQANYKKNFIIDSRYITNNPARQTMGEMPRFRHGVCEGGDAFGWTERTAQGRYLCPTCFGQKDLPAADPTAYSINSVILMPLYVHSTLFSSEEIQTLATQLVANYQSTGRLPSRPDGNIAVGYDYGLLLYTLTALGDPAASEIYKKMMEAIDPTGAWVEYYIDGKPSGTRCRPWESGINLEAAIHYLDAKYSRKD